MRIALTGASGYVGCHLTARLLEDPTIQLGALVRQTHTLFAGQANFEQWLEGHGACAHGWEAALLDFKPEIVIHLAALSSPAECDRDPQRAREINVTFSERVLEVAKQAGAFLIVFSSDWVFDGNTVPPGGFVEEEVPNARSVYAQTKRAVEVLASTYVASAIVRSALIYGPEIGNKKSSLSWLEVGFLGHGPLRLLEDEWRTPVFINDVIELVLCLIKSRRAGIYHCAGPVRMSRVEFGEEFAYAMGYSPALITRIRLRDIPELAGRPSDLSLNVERTCGELGCTFRSPLEAFICLKELRY